MIWREGEAFADEAAVGVDVDGGRVAGAVEDTDHRVLVLGGRGGGDTVTAARAAAVPSIPTLRPRESCCAHEGGFLSNVDGMSG